MMMTETKAYGMRLKDHEALMASSSGGAFTALSDVFLNSGNAVVCSSFDFETHRQEFRVITSKKERDAARGSKYFQSVPGDSFRQKSVDLFTAGEFFPQFACRVLSYPLHGAKRKGLAARGVLKC